MDNMSFYYTKRIERICSNVGVRLVYLAPYSPDLNLIEKFLAESKGFITGNWHTYEENPDPGFDVLLECVLMLWVRENRVCTRSFSACRPDD
jgi:transposase